MVKRNRNVPLACMMESELRPSKSALTPASQSSSVQWTVSCGLAARASFPHRLPLPSQKLHTDHKALRRLPKTSSAAMHHYQRVFDYTRQVSGPAAQGLAGTAAPSFPRRLIY